MDPKKRELKRLLYTRVSEIISSDENWELDPNLRYEMSMCLSVLKKLKGDNIE
ncbi:hypothetical protein SFB97_13220 [Enterococcus hirae]|uniref:hypothetical protein n=1 Tax=Enterococcus TaxID=1350 RepID=UPI0013EB14A0|nr:MULTISPECIES: hypothetical protein [Enterococcus]MEB5970150.1 hypothetical protein [Enterococcus gallinarum]HAQ3904957.1 hypothetical protein [Enterococcus faecium]